MGLARQRRLQITLLVTVLVAVASCYFLASSYLADPLLAKWFDNRETPQGAGNVSISPIGPEAPPQPPSIRPVFEDAAKSQGVDFSFRNDIVPGRFFLPEIMGGGAAWLDYDLDGNQDLYLVNGGRLPSPNGQSDSAPDIHNALFRNAAGFENVAAESYAEGGTAYGQGCAVGDFNADGFPDLFLANYGANTLLLNNGDGTFSDESESLGPPQQLWSTSCLWVDLNADGLLDLYCLNYLDARFDNIPKNHTYGGKSEPAYAGPGEFEATPDQAFLNQGDGGFREASEELGLVGENGKGLAVAAMDFDGDGLVEIYVANDMTPNFLFTRSIREGETRSKLWRDVALGAGCAASGDGRNEASMGLSCADFTSDGLPDIFVSHFHESKSTLYRNLGQLAFRDVSDISRISRISHDTLGFGTVPIDYEGNGQLDIFVTNGHVLGPNYSPNEMRPQLFLNEASSKSNRARFRDISEFAGSYFRGVYLGRGAASSDFDNDGDLDIGVTHVIKPFALLENKTAQVGGWIGFDIQRADRSDPAGVQVSVSTGGEVRRRQVVAGGSYLCSQDSRLLIATAPGDTSVRVSVRWANGVESQHELVTGRYWRIVQGQQPYAR